MSYRTDLHTHSTASDGKLRPSEVVLLASQSGIRALALTDHDTSDGVAEAQRAGHELGIEVIAGVEINSEGEHGDTHILGLFIDSTEPNLQEQLLAIRGARVGRAKGMLKKLAAMGMPVEWARVQAIAGNASSIARPHIARAMMEAGYVATLQEAFDRYIANDGPAYVNRLRLTMDEAIGSIHGAGGLAVMAHPALSGLVHLVPRLVEAGLDGVEVYYPEHTPEQQAKLLDIAERYNLVVTGGSDFHALDDPGHAQLGSVDMPPDVIEKLKSRLK
jgi:predicted metal-dependent phosphoesterase TrpH